MEPYVTGQEKLAKSSLEDRRKGSAEVLSVLFKKRVGTDSFAFYPPKLIIGKLP
jgi:hypothetical protein